MSSSAVAFETVAAQEDSEIYRSVSRQAVFCLLLGILGIFAFSTPALIILPFAGLFFGFGALYNLKKYPTELTGKPVAFAGLAINAMLALSTPIYHAYIYATEVPDGYERVLFSTLMTPIGTLDVPPERALELDGKKVFIKGYVHPTSVTSGSAKNFVLVPDWATCCFGGQPRLTHMIEVTLVGDLALQPSNRKLRLAGTLSVDPQLKPISGLQGVYYQLRADHLQ